MASGAGIILAAVALIEPIIHLGEGLQKSAQNALNFGKDAELFRVSFNHERRRLEALRKILLEKEFGPENPSTLFELFPDDWQADLFDELRQLRILYVELESIEARYGIFAPSRSVPTGIVRVPTDAMIDLSLDDRREFDLRKSVSAKQLSVWAFRDSKRTQDLMSRLQQWINRYRETVAMYLWAYFEDRKHLEQLQNDGDAQALDLANAARLRQIMLNQIRPGEKLLIRPSDIKQQTKLGQLSGRLYGALFEHSNVLLEHKEYDRDADAEISRQTMERVSQLAAILQQQNSRSLHVLRCQGYFVDAAHARYTFVYKIPDNVRNSPISLLSAISEGDKFKSTLKHRVYIACTLSETLHNLHLVGWVHKSLRSENVLLFPRTSSDNPQTPDTKDIMTHRSTRFEYVVPWLVGFEYARVVSGDSDLVTDEGIQRNMYRHPERWNTPTHIFSKIHDIYALGTILLEIGLWKPIQKLSETGFSRAEGADNSAAGQLIKETVRTQLLNHAEKLPYSLGRSYHDLVIACLKGSAAEGFDVDPTDGEGLQKAFRARVVEPLNRLLATI